LLLPHAPPGGSHQFPRPAPAAAARAAPPPRSPRTPRGPPATTRHCPGRP